MPTLDERIAAARKLTGYSPGPWKWWTSNSWRRLKHDSMGLTLSVLEPFLTRDGHADCSVSAEDQDLIAAAPDLHRLALDLAAERERLRGLLWYAWYEFNAIRARSGAPITHDGMTTVAEECWDQMTEAFEAAIGEDAAKPWPSPEARAALASEPRA